MQASETLAGFSEPVGDAQSVFRAVMTALSRPGRVIRVAASPEAPSRLPQAMAAIVLALADYETPVWLDDELSSDDTVRQFLSFQTGAPITAQPSEATLAFSLNAAALPRFDSFAQGTLEYPDRSTTIVAAVDSLTAGEAMAITGPGINGQDVIAPLPLPKTFRQWMALNRAQFPCGVDLILVSDDGIIGLPRTVQIMEQ